MDHILGALCLRQLQWALLLPLSQFPFSLLPGLHRVGQLLSNCANPAQTVSFRALHPHSSPLLHIKTHFTESNSQRDSSGVSSRLLEG